VLAKLGVKVRVGALTADSRPSVKRAFPVKLLLPAHRPSGVPGASLLLLRSGRSVEFYWPSPSSRLRLADWYWGTIL
jgi:hypothetical protein